MSMKKQNHLGLTIPMRGALAAAVKGAVAVRPSFIAAPRSGVTDIAHSTLRALANMRLIKPREGQTAIYVASLHGRRVAANLGIAELIISKTDKVVAGLTSAPVAAGRTEQIVLPRAASA